MPILRRCPTLALGAAALLVTLAAGCARTVDNMVAGAVSHPTSQVVAYDGAAPMPGNPQMLMTHRVPLRPGDMEHADQIATIVREGIAKYRDSTSAIAAGYREFPPNPSLRERIVHFTNYAISSREEKRIDPAHPGSLLYERMSDGSLRLVGAMFTAPISATIQDLDNRVPLSITQWHLHQNICVPRPFWDKEKWARRTAGDRPVFGPGSPITTVDACEHEGGRLLPTVLGWMAHVYVYAPDRRDLWNPMYGEEAGGMPGMGTMRGDMHGISTRH